MPGRLILEASALRVVGFPSFRTISSYSTPESGGSLTLRQLPAGIAWPRSTLSRVPQLSLERKSPGGRLFRKHLALTGGAIALLFASVLIDKFVGLFLRLIRGG